MLGTNVLNQRCATCGLQAKILWSAKALVFPVFFRCKINQKELVAAKYHTNFMRRPFWIFTREKPIISGFFFLQQNHVKTKKIFTLNLGDIWAGTAISTTTLACGLILLCAFGPAMLMVAHPCFKLYITILILLS